MTEDFLTEAFITLKDKWKAEDALQEAFCRLWGKRFKASNLKDAVGTLSRTGNNIRIDEWRRRSRHRTVGLQDAGYICFESDGKEEKEALFKKVEDSLDRELTPLQRRIVRMREYEGLSYEAISRALDMKPEAVRMHISRARRFLRDKFKSEDETD